MHQIFETILRIFSRKQEQLYLHAFNLWNEMCQEEFELKIEHINFIFETILPVLFHTDNAVKAAAFKAFQSSIKHLAHTDYRHTPNYNKFVKNICEELAPKLKNEMLADSKHWHEIWCLLLELIQQDVSKSIMINSFLNVAEAGFRNPDSTIRTKQFICWRKLIEIFAKEGQLRHWKRVKLSVTPLAATPSKTLEMAVEKFKCWWYLINNISHDMCKDPSLCLEPFLVFCFGPFSDIPLFSYTRNFELVSPGKMYSELSITVVVALISLLGKLKQTTVIISRNTLVENFGESKLNLAPVYVDCRRPLIHSCAEATVLIAINNEPSLTRNLWLNLFSIIRTSNEGTENSFTLIMESIEAMLNLSNSEELYMCLKPVLGTVFDVIRQNPIFPFGIKGDGVGVLSKAVAYLLNVLQQTNSGVMSDELLDRFMTDFILPNFQKIAVEDNKLAFVKDVCRKYCEISIGEKNCERNYTIHKFIFNNLVLKINKGSEFVIDFLAYGLKFHYTNMISDHKTWLINWEGMPKNQYLNMLSKKLLEVSESHSMSYDNVDMMETLLYRIDFKFDQTNAPKDPLILYSAYFKQLLTTEFAEKFFEIFNKFFTYLDNKELILVSEELTQILELTKKSSSKLTKALRQKLTSKIKDLEADPQHKDLADCQKFIKAVNKWLGPNGASEVKKQRKSSDGRTEYAVVNSDWKFDPKVLTEHQREKMKERRDDIPALYNDNTQSQDSHSIQPWTPKVAAAPASPSQESTKTPPKSPTKSLLDEKENSSRTKELRRLKMDIVNGDQFGVFNDGPTLTRNGKLKDTVESPPKRLRARRISMDSHSTRVSTPEPKKDSLNMDEQQKSTSPLPEKLATSSRKSLNRTKDPEKSRKSKSKENRENGSKDKSKRSTTVDSSISLKATEGDASEVVRLEHSVPEKAKQTPSSPKKKPEILTDPAADTEPMSDSVMEVVQIQEADTIEATPMEAVHPPFKKIPFTKIIQETTIRENQAPSDNVDLTIFESNEMNLAIEITSDLTNTSAVNQLSIHSSPELEDTEQREATFLNDTINISPIPKASVTRPEEEVANDEENEAAKEDEILTTPKRVVLKTTKDQTIRFIPTPHTNLLTRVVNSSRGAQMLSLNKQQTTNSMHASTPKDKVQPDDVVSGSEKLKKMLKLPRTVPSPKASPSTSILRRKRLEESLDETMESPAAKKKRVSFSDPPVSALKEFERDAEQTKNRPMVPVHKFPRHSKADSHKLMPGIAAYVNGNANESDSDTEIEFVQNMLDREAPMAVPQTGLRFEDEDEMYSYIFKQHVQEEDSEPITNSQCNRLMSVVLKRMEKNDIMKETLVGKFVNKFPIEVLDHALMENSPSIVLEKLPTRCIVNKIKTDKAFAKQFTKDMLQGSDLYQFGQLFQLLATAATEATS